jgi:PAS domain S-box-containing protein
VVVEQTHGAARPDLGLELTTVVGAPLADAAEQVFQGLLAQPVIGFALLDADLRYLLVNARLAQINGLPVEEHTGRTLAEVVPPLAEPAEAAFREVLRTGRPMPELTFTAVLPAGGTVERHWMESAYPVRDRTGTPVAVAVLVWEVTDRVVAERRREQMLALLELLILRAPIGIAFLDRQLRYVRVSENLAAANGLPVEEHLGRPLHEVIPEVAPQIIPDLRTVLETGRAIIDLQLQTPPRPPEHERPRHWQLSYYPVFPVGPGGEPADEAEGVGVIVSDLTERVEAEQERARLHEAERAARAEAERARERLDLLARASDLLSRSLDEPEVLEQLTRLIIPEWADWLVVLLPDGRGRLVPRISVHADPDWAEVAAVAGSTIVPVNARLPAARVFRTGQQLYLDDVRPDLFPPATPATVRALAERIGPSPALLVPMVVRGRVVGVLSLVDTSGRPGALGGDRELFADLARRAGIALDNARLYGQRTRVAGRLQESLLPERLPPVPGAEVAVRYTTAEEAVEVGGDFYDLVALSEDEHFVVVGDVSGRGVDAAAVTGLARHTLRAFAHELSPGSALARLGEVLYTQDAGERFVTAVAGRLRRTRRSLVVDLARAGHTHPLIVRAGGLVESVRSEGALLGAFPGVVLEETRHELLPGDTLLLYTDGITESRRGDELFGEERLAAAAAGVAGAGAETVVDAVLAAVEAFRTAPAEDDTALLVVHVVEPAVRTP